MLFSLRTFLSLGTIGVPAVTSTVFFGTNLFGNFYTPPATRIFQTSTETTQQGDCKAIKLSDSAKWNNLKLWVCSDEKSPNIPVFYLFYKEHSQQRDTQILENLTAHKVSKIELKQVKTSSHQLGKYELNIFLSNGEKTWARLYPSPIYDYEDEVMTEEEFNEKDGFFLKNSLDVLNVKDCQMVTTQPSGNWNSLKCLEKEYSLTDNNQVFF